MPIASLAEYLEQLERQGLLLRVAAEVDPQGEAAAIAQHALRVSPGGAIFFERVTGHPWPVVVNLLAQPRRVLAALECDHLAEAQERLSAQFQPAAGGGWMQRLRQVASGRAPGEPRKVKTGPVQQVVRLGQDIQLTSLPALQLASLPGKRMFHAGHFLTQDPQSGMRGTTPVSVEVLSERTLRVHAHWHEAVCRHNQVSQRQGAKLPVAWVVGGDPLLELAVRLPALLEADAYGLVSLFRGRPLDLVAGRSIPLDVPAEAEVIIEGLLDSSSVLEVQAVTHRVNPVFPLVVPSPAPNETTRREEALTAWVLPLLKQQFPELIDVALHGAAGRQTVAISLQNSYEGQARQLIHGLWSSPWFMFSRMIVLVDADVNVRDLTAVMHRVATRSAAGRDVITSHGPHPERDPAVEPNAKLERVAIDATASSGGKDSVDRHLLLAERSPEIETQVAERWQQYGLPEAQ